MPAVGFGLSWSCWAQGHTRLLAINPAANDSDVDERPSALLHGRGCLSWVSILILGRYLLDLRSLTLSDAWRAKNQRTRLRLVTFPSPPWPSDCSRLFIYYFLSTLSFFFLGGGGRHGETLDGSASESLRGGPQERGFLGTAQARVPSDNTVRLFSFVYFFLAGGWT